MIHELMHATAYIQHRSQNPKRAGISDIYQEPFETTQYYDLMSMGVYDMITVNTYTYSLPTILTGHTRMQLGYISPYTVAYGENEINIRLWQTTEDDFTNTESRIKLIKVPLRPTRQKGYRALASGTLTREYLGEEYLMLEWRNKSDFSSSVQNFDAGLPSEGLAIYRCIEGRATPYQSNPNGSWHGSELYNTIELIDATPPLPYSYTSIDTYVSARTLAHTSTPSLFGAASGVMQYIAADQWNWRHTNNFVANIQLSSGDGNKNLYAKFMDMTGRIFGTAPVTVTLSTSNDTTPPVINLDGLLSNATLSGIAHTVPTVSDNVDVDRVEVRVDGTLVDTGYASQYFAVVWDTHSFANGSGHTVVVTAYDAANNSSTITRTNITIAN